MENSKVKMSEATYFDSRIDFRIANPDVFRTAMQLPLNGTAYSAHRGDECLDIFKGMHVTSE